MTTMMTSEDVRKARLKGDDLQTLSSKFSMSMHMVYDQVSDIEWLSAPEDLFKRRCATYGVTPLEFVMAVRAANLAGCRGLSLKSKIEYGRSLISGRVPSGDISEPMRRWFLSDHTNMIKVCPSGEALGAYIVERQGGLSPEYTNATYKLMRAAAKRGNERSLEAVRQRRIKDMFKPGEEKC